MGERAQARPQSSQQSCHAGSTRAAVLLRVRGGWLFSLFVVPSILLLVQTTPLLIFLPLCIEFLFYARVFSSG